MQPDRSLSLPAFNRMKKHLKFIDVLIAFFRCTSGEANKLLSYKYPWPDGVHFPGNSINFGVCQMYIENVYSLK